MRHSLSGHTYYNKTTLIDLWTDLLQQNNTNRHLDTPTTKKKKLIDLGQNYYNKATLIDLGQTYYNNTTLIDLWTDLLQQNNR